MQENAVLYGAIAVCTAPLIYLTRKYSVPAILYLVEFVIYACVMHVVMWLLVKVTRWFKEQSSMKALNEDGVKEIQSSVAHSETALRRIIDERSKAQLDLDLCICNAERAQAELDSAKADIEADERELNDLFNCMRRSKRTASH